MFAVFQMYSFVYEESETWAIWSNDIDLLAFNGGSSNIVISHIFRQLFDDVRKQINDLDDKIQTQKSTLTIKLNELLNTLEDYRSEVQTNEVFVRYFSGTTYCMRIVFFIVLAYFTVF